MSGKTLANTSDEWVFLGNHGANGVLTMGSQWWLVIAVNAAVVAVLVAFAWVMYRRVQRTVNDVNRTLFDVHRTVERVRVQQLLDAPREKNGPPEGGGPPPGGPIRRRGHLSLYRGGAAAMLLPVVAMLDWTKRAAHAHPVASMGALGTATVASFGLLYAGTEFGAQRTEEREAPPPVAVTDPLVPEPEQDRTGLSEQPVQVPVVAVAEAVPAAPQIVDGAGGVSADTLDEVGGEVSGSEAVGTPTSGGDDGAGTPPRVPPGTSSGPVPSGSEPAPVEPEPQAQEPLPVPAPPPAEQPQPPPAEPPQQEPPPPDEEPPGEEPPSDGDGSPLLCVDATVVEIELGLCIPP